jgi:hypothetical protein
MKPVIELSSEDYECLLKQLINDKSPLYLRLKHAVKTRTNTLAVLCDAQEASMLLEVAKRFCPDAVEKIETASRFARVP